MVQAYVVLAGPSLGQSTAIYCTIVAAATAQAYVIFASLPFNYLLLYIMLRLLRLRRLRPRGCFESFP